MLIPKHWTFKYGRDLFGSQFYRWTHPGAPWMNRQAVRELERIVRPETRVFEWGSGGSTIWFAQRTHSLQSVEHNPRWHRKVKGRLNKVPGTREARLHHAQGTGYVSVIEDYPDDAFDLVLVDGVWRAECANTAIQKVRPGGYLVLDDAERYIPHESRSPDAIGPIAKPPTSQWSDFLDAIMPWTLTWTTDGVSDAAFWRRP